MNDISKRASYIKGLADGLNIDNQSNEGKIIVQLLSLVCDMADEIEELKGNISDIDELNEMADDVLDMSKKLGDGDYDDLTDDDYDYDDEDDLYEIECPHCHEDVMIEFDMIDEDNSIICPNCHEEIPLEFDFDDDYEEE